MTPDIAARTTGAATRCTAAEGKGASRRTGCSESRTDAVGERADAADAAAAVVGERAADDTAADTVLCAGLGFLNSATLSFLGLQTVMPAGRRPVGISDLTCPTAPEGCCCSEDVAGGVIAAGTTLGV